MLDIDILKKVAATTKRLEKEALLKRMMDICPDSGKFLRYTYDRQFIFYVTVDEDEMVAAWKTAWWACEPTCEDGSEPFDFWGAFDALCCDLSDRKVTGHAALKRVTDLLQQAPTTAHAVWASRVLNKDLRAGFSASTINKVYGDIIEVFEVALAESYDPESHELEGEYVMEPKLDGNRVVIVEGVALSRNGKVYESFPHIVEELRELSFHYLIDGEMMAGKDFDANSGALRRKSKKAEDAYYNVFDLVPLDEWRSGKFFVPLHERKRKLKDVLVESKTVRLVPWQYVSPLNTETLFAQRDALIKQGFEGGILKDLNAPYTPGKSGMFLKLKVFDPADGKIVGVQEHRKHKGWLGSFLVEVDGVVSRCGSGLTQLERIDLWKRRGEIIGRYIQMEFQQKTPSGALRFPTYVKFRPDKD